MTIAEQRAADAELVDLLGQALETERGGIAVYQQALSCALNGDLRETWIGGLEHARWCEAVLRTVFQTIGLEDGFRTQARQAIAEVDRSLVCALTQVRRRATLQQAQLVACQCVLVAQTRHQAQWDVLAHVAEHGRGLHIHVLRKAVRVVMTSTEQPPEQSRGWLRELSIEAVGLPALLPPPEVQGNMRKPAASEFVQNYH